MSDVWSSKVAAAGDALGPKRHTRVHGPSLSEPGCILCCYARALTLLQPTKTMATTAGRPSSFPGSGSMATGSFGGDGGDGGSGDRRPNKVSLQHLSLTQRVCRWAVEIFTGTQDLSKIFADPRFKHMLQLFLHIFHSLISQLAQA